MRSIRLLAFNIILYTKQLKWLYGCIHTHAYTGKAGEMIDRGDNTYGGKYVINPSGGLISKGHPLGATGLAQCAELCWQLRGEADLRQVPGAKLGLQHNLGLGGACVVSLYKLGFPSSVPRCVISVCGRCIVIKLTLLEIKVMC